MAQCFCVRLVAVLMAWLVLAPTVRAQARVDALGDPLPEGAIARIGTTRMRHFGLPEKSTYGIGCIAWSPDGKVIATTSFTFSRVGVEARIWDAATGKPLKVLEKNESYGPSFVRFAPDSKTVAAACRDKIVIWDVASGKELGQLIGHLEDVVALEFQDGGKVIVSLGRDGVVRWWNVAGRKMIGEWKTLAKEPKKTAKGEPIEMRVDNGCFSPDAKSLAIEKGSTEGRVAMVFELDGRKENWREVVHRTCDFAFTSDGKRMVMTGGRFSVRDVATGKVVAMAPSPAWDGYVAFSPDDGTVAICIQRGIAFWLLNGKSPIREIPINNTTTSPVFSPDGKKVAVNSSRTFRLLDAVTGKSLVDWHGYDAALEGLAFAADGSRLLASYDPSFYNMEGVNTTTWRPQWDYENPYQKFSGAKAVTPDHRLVVNGLDLVDMESGKSLARIDAHLDRIKMGLKIHNGFFSPMGRLYVMRDCDGVEQEIDTIFTIPSGKHLCQLHVPNHTHCWSFSGDESKAAFFERYTGMIHVHHTATGKLLWQLGKADPDWKRDSSTLALSPDGNMLAVWTLDNWNVQIWDLRVGTRHRTLAVNQAAGNHVAACLAWSPDSRVLAVGGVNNSVQLWEVASAKIRREFHGHDAPVRCMAFSPDGRVLVSSSIDTTLLVWDVH